MQVVATNNRDIGLSKQAAHSADGKAKLVQALVPLREIRPAPENNHIYRSISVDSVRDLIRSIRKHGVLEPLRVSLDGYILSGRRRHFAAGIIGLAKVPVFVHPISRTKNSKAFLKLLVEFNSQRIKGADELLHEAAIKIDPLTAHAQLRAGRIVNEAYREQDCTLEKIRSANDGAHCKLSPAKQPMLEAIQRIIEEQRGYWPLSIRQVHYRLLGPNAPLKHASKPNSRYTNTRESSNAASDVAARGRLEGLLPWEPIEDETRPVDLNSAFHNLEEFFGQETENFLSGYWRNLLQSQPNYIEIIAEKLTLRATLSRVAQEHTMPMTIGRGMCSLSTKRRIYERFRCSRKEKLILLIVSDLDPAGDAIAEDYLKSFRRDFSVHKIEAYKVALTIEQVRELKLPPSMEAKRKSPTYAAYVKKYGTSDCWELEALEPAALAEILTRAIEGVIDASLFNQEIRAEQDEAAKLVAMREQCAFFFRSLRLD